VHRIEATSKTYGFRSLAWGLVLATTFLGSACTVLEVSDVEESPATTVDSATPDSGEQETPAVLARAPDIPVPLPRLPNLLVLTSSDAANYSDVADELDRRLGSRFELERMSLASMSTEAVTAAAADVEWTAAIAIGMDAAELATAQIMAPVVFCQILDYRSLLASRDSIYGVEALPPLALQLRSWQQIAPNVRRVGVIVSEDQTELVGAAREAAAAVGLELHVEYAATDRELLYRFKRIAPSLDGIWLLPDRKILSPSALNELFPYAQSHGVHTLVFNPSLLQWGALISLGNDPADVAAQVSRVVDAVADGRTSELRRVTPLSAVRVQINEGAASALGVPLAAVGARLEAAVH